jgi:uncharacterized membrane protein (UPF0127 family)
MRGALVLLATLALALAGCDGGSDATTAGAPGSPAFEQANASIETANGTVDLDVEIAETEAQRDFGLMQRKSLADDAGMAFLFPEDVSATFWMKDTLIPLSVAFADADGTILEILDMEPCNADPCPTYDPGVQYRTALEVNKGAFERLGVARGDTLTIER